VLAPEWERAMVHGSGYHVSSGHAHAPSQGPSNGTLSKFVDGLRLIDPCVSVIGVESEPLGVREEVKGRSQPLHASVLPMHVQLDAKIPVYSSTQAVIDAVEMAYRKRHQGAGNPVQSTLPAQTEEPGEEVGDSLLLDLLLKGKDILPVAVRLIQQRCSGTVEYIPVGEIESVPAGSVVLRGGIVIGALRGSDQRVLDAQALWLSKWLKASDQHRQLRTAAFTDALTGAWNRRYFVKHLESSLEIAKSLRRDLLVLVFDVDNFKRYNDQFGHQVGDDILTEVARLMGSVVRPSDRVCRIGGDEFAVVFFDPQGPRKPGSTNRVSVVEMAERFRAKIATHTFPKLAGIEGAALTISGGMAVYPWDGATAGELVDRADQLAREGKQEGKNIIRFGDVHLQDSE
jgi:diguanylate cyclase (GGDEF)-like protein